MKIDITNSDYNELLSLLAQFPNGKVTAKNGAAFWDCTNENVQPKVPKQMQFNQPQQNQQKQPSNNPFLRAFDSMAERF